MLSPQHTIKQNRIAQQYTIPLKSAHAAHKERIDSTARFSSSNSSATQGVTAWSALLRTGLRTKFLHCSKGQVSILT